MFRSLRAPLIGAVLLLVPATTMADQAVSVGGALALLNKPGAPANDAALEKDYRAEFARRFLLVTGDTVDEWMRNYPQLF